MISTSLFLMENGRRFGQARPRLARYIMIMPDGSTFGVTGAGPPGTRMLLATGT